MGLDGRARCRARRCESGLLIPRLRMGGFWEWMVGLGGGRRRGCKYKCKCKGTGEGFDRGEGRKVNERLNK